jgi:diguanylate cyclase (GGDEF)-like protein
MSDLKPLPTERPSVEPTAAAEVERRRMATESRVAEISSLLSALEEAANAPIVVPPRSTVVPPTTATASTTPTPNTPAPPAAAAPVVLVEPAAVSPHENQLVVARLGLASGLFAALRVKRPELAAHSLRTAMGCSTWAMFKRLDDETRDAAEVAGLLHELGALGLADATSDAEYHHGATTEQRLRGAEIAVEILGQCCKSPRVLDAVRCAALRFDGVGGPEGLAGDRIPLEARMIAVVHAYDAMTSSLAGPQPLSREQALAELLREAGKRFDPILVSQFSELIAERQEALSQQLAERWFVDLGRQPGELPWQSAAGSPAATAEAQSATTEFEHQLVDLMQDGVVFVDAAGTVFRWGKGAERMTGLSSAAATGRQFTPALLDMCNTAGRRVRDDACPVARALANGAQLKQRLEILGRAGGRIAVDLLAIPVLSQHGEPLGATVIIKDAQPEATLEEKCDALNAEITRDPMTKVANRAEFDRMLALYIDTHDQAGMPCSLIMTDIDHFKSINDTYGHQAGDEAIITVANLLRELCRSGDLVARYGGEEFAVLCADCTAADAAQRAEQIRRRMAETAHSYLGNRRLTASFGVTQLQTGDTPEQMVARADRGLYLAKERGRNQVVPVGSDMDQDQSKRKRWWSFGAWKSQPIVEIMLTSEAPANIAVEKLRGFVTDYKAKVVATRDNRVVFDVSTDKLGLARRNNDRLSVYRLTVELKERREQRTNGVGLAAGTYAVTDAKLTIAPKKNRNRRAAEQLEQARSLVQLLKAYMMARESEQPLTPAAAH